MMAATTDEILSELPLKALHEAANARFGGFAGWNMPITYPLGVLKEHLHTRDKAGLFDISHMKLILVSGPQAAAALARACPLDPTALEESQSKYTFLLNDDAGILDDLIVTRLGETRFMVVANAGNAAADIARLTEIASGFDAKVEPLDRVFLALQGPAAEAALEKAGLSLSCTASSRAQAGSPAARAIPARTVSRWQSRLPRLKASPRRCLPTTTSNGSALPRAIRSGSKPGFACTGRTSTPIPRRWRPG
jgi:glycine cleavage system aminomethyltransferase T